VPDKVFIKKQVDFVSNRSTMCPMRILIIEDEREVADYLRSNFEKEGFIVDCAADGEEGSYLARINEYDIMIVDHLLPKKLGLDIIKEVREELKSLPIIMLSAKGDIEQKLDTFNAGVDDYLTKPFSFQELRARVQALLRRPYHVKSLTYTIDDLTIYSDRQEVLKNGRRLYLTRKEFSLLECLAKDNGKVLSRGAIMEHVWNMNIDPFSNTLETHILNLRKKIGKKGRKIIQTVPGRGYKIDVEK
jgi:DNA-binding response OmpR family regulator